MKTTLDKLVSKIKDCNFYRITFDVYDARRIWIIGKKNSYIEEIVADPDNHPDITDYYNVHLNVMETISISTNNKDKISLDIYPEPGNGVPSYEEEDNHFYMFESAECIDVIDFKDFDTSDEFFEDILRNLDTVLKDKYDISIKDLDFGQYFESPFGKENEYFHGTLYELAAYKPDWTAGIEVQSLLQEPLSNHGFVHFKKLSNIKKPYKSTTISYAIEDPKNEILGIIKKTVPTASRKQPHLKNTLDKDYKWLKTKIKGN